MMRTNMCRCGTFIMAAMLVAGLTACSGSSPSALPAGCTTVARMSSSYASGQPVDDRFSDLVPDSVERVSVPQPPQLKGGLRALQEDIDYPTEAKKNEKGGVVRVSFIVDKDGQPRNLEVARGAGYDLNQAALNAVRRQEFEPGTRNGRPICVPMTLPIRFWVD